MNVSDMSLSAASVCGAIANLMRDTDCADAQYEGIRKAYGVALDAAGLGRPGIAEDRQHLIDALTDCVANATDYGTQDVDFVAMYLLPTGPIHRAISLLERMGVTVRPGRPPVTSCRATYVEAPCEYAWDNPAVFLAGGITGCPDWQTQAYDQLAGLPVTVLNPRRVDFPIHDPSAAASQVDWEFRHLHHSEVVLFWFPDSGRVAQPIALYELGAHAATDKNIAVGADPGYVRRTDVILQLRHVRPYVVVRDNLADVCADVSYLLKR